MRWIVAGRAAAALLAPALVAFVALAACGNGPVAPDAAPSPTTVESAAPPPTATGAPAPPAVPLHVVGTGLVGLRGLGREGVVFSGDLVLVSDGKRLRQDPDDYPIDFSLSSFERFRGLAPGAVWIEKQGHFYRRADARWREVKLLGPGEALGEIVPWGEGRAAALVARDTGELRWVSADAGGPLPAAPRRLEGASPGDDAGGPARHALEPRGACSPDAGSETGPIILVGHDPQRLRTPLVERCAPGATESTLTELPKPRAHEDRDLCAVTAGPREAWIYGNGRTSYLAHFDGAAWTREEPPVEARPVTLVGRDDGAVFFVLPDALYLRLPSSPAWQPVALPEAPRPFPPLTSAALFAGQLWLTGGEDFFGPEPPPAVVAVPSYRIGATPGPPFPPMTEACTRPYVILQQRVPPAKKAYPDVVARIKQAIPLEGVELGTEMWGKFTHLGARVPTVGVATKLAAEFEGDARCHVPILLKKIPLETE